MMLTNRPIPKRQQGLSLAELMIGMVLGLIIISAVFNTYMGSTRSSRFSQGIQQIQENGRYGITTLQRGIRLAGFAPDGNLEPFDIANSSETEIVVRVTDRFDCNGSDTTAIGGIAINTYAHNPADDTITCTGNVGGIAMPVVEGVEAMRILWGVSADDDQVPDHYIPYSTSINPDEVIAMRVAILVNSGEPIRSRRGEERHVMFDTEIVTDDKIARNVFTSTVMLRNIESAWSGI